MDIGYLTSNAVRYSSKNWKKVLTLGILFLMGFLIVPAFMSLGYIFRVLKWSVANVDELPDFDMWGEMFFDSLKVFIVQLVYFIIPSAIIFIGIWTSIGSIMALPNARGIVDPDVVVSLMGGLYFFGINFGSCFRSFLYHSLG